MVAVDSMDASPVEKCTAKHRRTQAQRAQGRHVEWLVTVLQARGAHHTCQGAKHGGKQAQTKSELGGAAPSTAEVSLLVGETEQLRKQVAQLEATVNDLLQQMAVYRSAVSHLAEPFVIQVPGEPTAENTANKPQKKLEEPEGHIQECVEESDCGAVQESGPTGDNKEQYGGSKPSSWEAPSLEEQVALLEVTCSGEGIMKPRMAASIACTATLAEVEVTMNYVHEMIGKDFFKVGWTFGPATTMSQSTPLFGVQPRLSGTWMNLTPNLRRTFEVGRHPPPGILATRKTRRPTQPRFTGPPSGNDRARAHGNTGAGQAHGGEEFSSDPLF